MPTLSVRAAGPERPWQRTDVLPARLAERAAHGGGRALPDRGRDERRALAGHLTCSAETLQARDRLIMDVLTLSPPITT